MDPEKNIDVDTQFAFGSLDPNDSNIDQLARLINQHMGDDDIREILMPEDVMGKEWTLMITKGDIMEFTSFVEIGAPCVSAYIL